MWYEDMEQKVKTGLTCPTCRTSIVVKNTPHELISAIQVMYECVACKTVFLQTFEGSAPWKIKILV